MSTRPRYLTSPPFVRVRRARHVHYLSSPRERRGRGTRMRRWPPPAPPSGHPRRRLGGRLSRPWSPVRLKGERDSKEAIVHILLSIKNTSGPARSRRVATNERGGFPDPNPRRRVPPGKAPHGLMNGKGGGPRVADGWPPTNEGGSGTKPPPSGAPGQTPHGPHLKWHSYRRSSPWSPVRLKRLYIYKKSTNGPARC